MNGRGEFDAILRSWVDRHAPSPPEGLLVETMRKVDATAQRPARWTDRLQRATVWTWTGVAATLLLAALFVALIIRPGPPVGPVPGVPVASAASAAPSPPSEPTPTIELPSPGQVVNELIANWNAADEEAAANLYVPTARRFDLAGDAMLPVPVPSFTEGEVVTGTGPLLQQGQFVATGLRYASGRADEILALKLSVDGLIVREYVLPAPSAAAGNGQAMPSVGAASAAMEALVDGELAAMDAFDGVANSAYFAVDGVWRITLSDTWEEKYEGREAIAATTEGRAAIDFHVTRTGQVLQLGNIAVYPWIMTDTLGEAEGLVIIELTADGLIGAEWVVGVEV